MSDDLVVVEETTTPTTLEHSQFDLVDVEGASMFMQNYQDAIKALLTPEDYQAIAGKDFKKKSAWRKLATAFRISDEIVNEELIYDDVNQIVRARYRVKCILPNGRSAEGIGVCSIFDKIRYKATGKNKADTETPSNFELRGRFSNAEHDVPSTAHSRAKNRAIADLIGAGEVSAEEMAPPKNVSRTSRTNDAPETPEEEPVSKPVNSRRNSRKRRSRTPKVVEQNGDEVIVKSAEVIDAEVIEDNTTSSSSSPFKDNDNILVKKAISRLEGDGLEISKTSITDELFDMFNSEQIDLDQYEEATATLN